ncbi:hypothetical protein [Algoriphagus mannitolivorans]|uniref:hypothetical protein n=1 Tax=Algoriphagus mannitolivorans TaxID=226504 RepID=UPI00040C8C6D|nr:hypothetical protein [Algoriphagus mannitolivorans]
MERDLITLALQEIALKNGKDLNEVQQYLMMRYRIKVDPIALSKRLKKILEEEKAVA